MGPLLGTQTNVLFHRSSYESSISTWDKIHHWIEQSCFDCFFSKVLRKIVTISLHGVDGNPSIKVDNLNGWFGCAQGIPQLCKKVQICQKVIM